MAERKEYRCNGCGKLLFKGDVKEAVIEVKCSKCGLMNKIIGALLKIKKHATGK